MSLAICRALRYAVCLLVLAAACSQPIPSPTADQLKSQFSVDLPAYWRAKTFQVEAAQRGGDEKSPTYRARFRAEVELGSSTYTEAGREGDVAFIRLMGKPGETRTVYGRVQASWKDGAWQSMLTLENDPTRSLGVPRDFIQAARMIVSGSTEEQAYRDEQRRREEERVEAEAAAVEAGRERFLSSLAGEWYGSAFDETDSRLWISRDGSWMSAVLIHQGFREDLTVEILAGDQILLTGYNVVRLDGKRAQYNLDTFELTLSADGTFLHGTARDRGRQTGIFSMRRVGG